MTNETEGKHLSDALMDEYYGDLLSSDADERAEKEYVDNIRLVQRQFLEKTRMHSADLPYLFLGVALQCIRIYVVNKLTEIEKANVKGGREENIHDVQDKILSKFGTDEAPAARELYTPLSAIITLRGVPYDATAPGFDEIKRLRLFKGADHRFSTLGHDPLLGIVFGTANILTGTVTTNTLHSYRVFYDEFLKNPRIGARVSTRDVLAAAAGRLKDDKRSIAAALIKQLLHVQSDLYTPTGIALPCAGLVMNKTTVEKLTEYVSTGDVLKAGASAGLSALIGLLVAALHGSKLLFDNDGPFDEQLCPARTKKVVMYSDLIASTSNIIVTAFTGGGAEKTDWGGLFVTLYRVVSDTGFIFRLEKEFIDSEVSAIYEKKLADAEMI